MQKVMLCTLYCLITMKQNFKKAHSFNIAKRESFDKHSHMCARL